MEAKLAEAETARAELTKKLTAKQQELDRVVQATTERQDALRKELEESRNKMAGLEKQLQDARAAQTARVPQMAGQPGLDEITRAAMMRAEAARIEAIMRLGQPGGQVVTTMMPGRVGIAPPGDVREDHFAEQLAQAVGLSPTQKQNVTQLVRDMRAELKRLWTTSKAASAPPAAFELLQRDLDQRMKRDIEALLEGEQREAYRQWEERRHRPAGEPQPRTANQDQQRRTREELARYEDAMQRGGFMQLATSLQLTPEQRQRLETAHQAEQNEAKRLWTEPKADAAEALRALEQWQAIRQRTNEQLREVLRAEQLDRYREWCDSLAAPRQMTMGGRAWWGEGGDVQRVQRQDDM